MSNNLEINRYFKDIDKTITTYLNSEKGDEEYTPLQEAIDYKEKYMITKPITEEIKEKNKYKSYHISKYGDTPYENIEEMYKIIEEKNK